MRPPKINPSIEFNFKHHKYIGSNLPLYTMYPLEFSVFVRFNTKIYNNSQKYHSQRHTTGLHVSSCTTN
jgi:hypothetical protein